MGDFIILAVVINFDFKEREITIFHENVVLVVSMMD
jgi:hypothetical protein